MNKIILIYGVVAGLVIIGSMILTLSLSGADSRGFSEWLGYLIMIIALGLIFVGIKRYRDHQLGGVIKFVTALKLGVGISLVASVIYVAAWEANLSLTDHQFIYEYTDSIIGAKESAGVTGAELEAVVAEMEEMKERYGNPLYRLPITFLEIFPVGLLITLLCATVLRNRNFLPAS